MTTVAVTLKDIFEYTVENKGGLGVYKKDVNGDWRLEEYLDVEENNDDYPKTTQLTVAGFKGGRQDMEDSVNNDKSVLFKFHTEYDLPQIIKC